MEPNNRGWRMMCFDVRAPNGQIIEYQIVPREMHEAGKITHPIYEKWRNVDIRQISYKEQLNLEKDFNNAQKVCLKAWSDYLHRTGQTEQQVRGIMRNVGEHFPKDKE